MRTRGVLHLDTDVTVPFFDVDSMNVVWHGHYVKYLEIARCASSTQSTGLKPAEDRRD